ncbi:DEAD/DEAH box helicase [Alkalibacterium putridalgicola]|uniref:DEAD/DEAH box helicase n=1 Tax=Alkalibacterium putridalgicola TaxID=426703 RepID=UPI0034CFAEFE
MSLDPIVASKNIVDKYLRYMETTFFINDKDYMDQFTKQINKPKHFAKGPYLDFSDSFEFGTSISSMIDEGILSNEFKKMYGNQKNQGLLSRKLYKHQELAIRKLNEDKNIVVTTGTGSGKTEAFLLPIINHLMREKEQGSLTDGVRALIVYPMNALANDQMKRMREMLNDYPDISFGAYTGETEKEDTAAYHKYLSLNDNQKPLSNERISRNQMKERPPHIFITNYAMLEYLLLRPDDNVFFHGEKSKSWKYIVLDEAHTYTGATGIEVSMLMRRLINTLQTTKEIRFILTSATLGDEGDNENIKQFASALCAGQLFNTDSIVRAIRFSDFKSSEGYRYPSHIYKELLEVTNHPGGMNTLINNIQSYNPNFNTKSKEMNEIIYDFILSDALYYEMRNILNKDPVTINKISETLGINELDIVSFVSLARKAGKNNISLLDARYHMFVRSLEGAFITVGKHKDLTIIPRDKTFINGEEFVSYKITVCKHCGEIYIPGTIENDYLKQSKSEDMAKEYYLVANTNKLDVDESDINEDQYYTLCGQCGKIEKKNLVNSVGCSCHEENLVDVIQVETNKNMLHKCVACNTSSTRGPIVRGFYIGQEAAASVIGSSLYEEIPSKIEEIKDEEELLDNDFFGFESVEETRKSTVNTFAQNKQLLVFSDSRQEAAYFASYFDFTYNNILRRRLLVEALTVLGEAAPESGIEIIKLVNKLAALFEHQNVLEQDQDSLKEAWKTVLYEISSSDRNSLENLGLVSFQFKDMNLPQLGEVIGEDADTLLRVLANSFKRDCKIEFPYSKEMLKADKEYYLYNGLESTMSLSVDPKDRKHSWRKSWISAKYMNSRMEFLSKVLDTDDREKINNYLEKIWQLLVNKEIIAAKRSNEYVMNVENLVAKPSNSFDVKWYTCDKCGKLTVNNIDNHCSTYRCYGKLRECNVEKMFETNHYRKQYLNLDIYPLRIKEHTAQLSSEKAKRYQEMFIKNEINVLSCSTTFEMGVDVGDLETVFMKNMPPSPSNYAQRAGRAGRRKESAAYSLTFSRLSSHDLNFYRKPELMIKGKIRPPKFKVENEKIVKRHMNAAVISAYWKKYPERYKNVELFFDEDNFRDLITFINQLPLDVERYIRDSLPDSLKNKTENWLTQLQSSEGILFREYNEFKNEIIEIEDLRLAAIEKMKGEFKRNYDVNNLTHYADKLKSENITSFLSKKNIIPKYGFPVDTVELVTSLDSNAIKNYSKSNNLRLQRDLMMAISEYAPGSEVIADGNLYKSQYIKKPSGQNKVWDLYDFGICTNPMCGHVNIKKHYTSTYGDELGNCEICDTVVYKENTFIIPEYGFIISPQVTKSTIKKPEKTYKSEIYYVGDKQEITENDSSYFKFNNNDIKIKSTSNDELVVINKSNFFVCDSCGYATKNDEMHHEHFFDEKKPHKTPFGRECSNTKLYRRTLGHKFKTDVANISFGQFIDFKEALSILYALLEGVSKQLGIERNDISGTVHYDKIKTGEWDTSFILFDVVPGGAGHVRRLGKANEEHFREVLNKSFEVVNQCDCGEGSNGEAACYSCLCNYYNQKHHDILKRKYAIDFFNDILVNSSISIV